MEGLTLRKRFCILISGMSTLTRKLLTNSGYSVKVSGSDGKKVLWEVVDDHVVEEGKEHDDIGLWGFDFNLIDKDKEGVFR